MSIQHENTLHRNKALLSRLRKVRPVSRHQSTEDSAFSTTSRQMVRSLLSALAPNASRPCVSVSKDIENLKNAIASILTAVDDKVLSDHEGEIVINYIAERFVERRFDDFLKHISMPQSQSWFLMGDHHTYCDSE